MLKEVVHSVNTADMTDCPDIAAVQLMEEELQVALAAGQPPTCCLGDRS